MNAISCHAEAAKQSKSQAQLVILRMSLTLIHFQLPHSSLSSIGYVPCTPVYLYREVYPVSLTNKNNKKKGREKPKQGHLLVPSINHHQKPLPLVIKNLLEKTLQKYCISLICLSLSLIFTFLPFLAILTKWIFSCSPSIKLYAYAYIERIQLDFIQR